MTAEDDKRTRPTRAQRLVAMGFLGACGLTIVTVLLTGLWVRAPSARRDEPPVAPTDVEQVDAPDQEALEPRADRLVEPNPTPPEPRPPGQDPPDTETHAPEDPEAQPEGSTTDRDGDAPLR